MNQVQLIGRMAREPELRRTEKGTPVVSFALAVDRLMPMIHNALTEGSAWQANGVVAEQVRRRAESISRGAPELGALAQRLIAQSVEAGYLPDR